MYVTNICIIYVYETVYVIHILFYIFQGKTGDMITFTHFEEGNLLSETHDDMESGNKSDDDSTLSPFISEEEMNAMSSSDEFDAEPMYTDMLEEISDGSKSNSRINRRESRCKICDIIKEFQ